MENLTDHSTRKNTDALANIGLGNVSKTTSDTKTKSPGLGRKNQSVLAASLGRSISNKSYSSSTSIKANRGDRGADRSNLRSVSVTSNTAQLFSFRGLKDKAGAYWDKEKNNEDAGFLKGSVGGVLGAAGGIVGGALGGLFGIGKAIYKRDISQIGKMAVAGGAKGVSTGRVVGSGIVDGTKALTGGAIGAATGALGGLGGLAYGAVKAAKNKDASHIGKGLMSGAKGGFDYGRGVGDAAFELADEAPELALNAARGGLGVAGGAIGGIGGLAYGAVQAAKNKDASHIGKGLMTGAKGGWNFGANSNATKKAVSVAASMGGAALGALAGPGGSVVGAGLGARGAAKYYGASNAVADISMLSSAGGAAIGGFGINADPANAFGGIANSNLKLAAQLGAKGGNALLGVGTDMGMNKINDMATKPSVARAAPANEPGFLSKYVTGNVEEKFSVENKAREQATRGGSILGKLIGKGTVWGK